MQYNDDIACCGTWWFFGRVDSCRPEGHGFESRSSRHVGTLDKSFTHSCLWRFGVKLRHSIRASQFQLETQEFQSPDFSNVRTPLLSEGPVLFLMIPVPCSVDSSSSGDQSATAQMSPKHHNMLDSSDKPLIETSTLYSL